MASILRLIVIVATALTILGWSLVAAQTPTMSVHQAVQRFRIETNHQEQQNRATDREQTTAAKSSLGVG